MTFRAAFYKGTRPGIPGLYNILVRKRGRGLYSHMELVFSDGLSASSSFEDKGVRFKKIDYNADRWDFIDLPPEWEPAARRYFEKRRGMRYSIRGNVHLTIGFVAPDDDKEFCSQACMGALYFKQAWRFEPNAAYVTTLRAVEMHRLAECQLLA